MAMNIEDIIDPLRMVYRKYDRWKLRNLEIPEWFDEELISTLRKKYDRSGMKKRDRTLDWFIRQNLKVLPSIMTGIETKKFSWRDIEGIIAENAGRMVASGYRHDVNMGIESGGAFIAPYVAKCCGMDLETVDYMKVCHYSANSRSIVKSSLTCIDKPAEIVKKPSIKFKGKHVLVIDDNTYTGVTLLAAVNYLMENGAASVKTFCLYTRRDVHVDFCTRYGMMLFPPWGKDA